MPLITIITSTLNAGTFIGKLGGSLAEQKFRDFEWLVVDGGSVDDTLDIIKNLNLAKLIVSEPDRGIYDAWNKALPHIKGEWVIFLGADDYLIDEFAFSDINSFLQSLSKDIQLAYCRVTDGETSFGRFLDPLEKEMSHGMAICHQALFHHRSIFDKFGFFDASYKIAGDYELVLRCIRGHAGVLYFPRIVTFMGQGGISSRIENGFYSAVEALKARCKNQYQCINFPWLKHFFKGITIVVLWKILPKSTFNVLKNIWAKLKA